MTRLTPNFFRVAIKVGFLVFFVSVLGYFFQGYNEGKWWTADYMFSLTIPAVFMIVFVWFAFVPRLMEFSETEITISTLLGKYTYNWSALDCYGPGDNVFMIKFSGDRQPYQIFAGAYPNEEWSKLIDFLNMCFPDRKMAYSIGVRMFRKRDK
jgi:hypothetical protein